jgi:PadR family transcriptional regulator, regulatory protein PadR
MEDKWLKRMQLGLMQLHVLYHARIEPIYGTKMMEELNEHGYSIGPSHIYPLLKEMEVASLLQKEERLENKKIRKYYHITPTGLEVYEHLSHQLIELMNEINEPKGGSHDHFRNE